MDREDSGDVAGSIAANPPRPGRPARGALASAVAADSAGPGGEATQAGAAGTAPARGRTGALLGRVLPALLRIMRSRLVRAAFLVAVLALLSLTLADQGTTLWHEVQRLSVPVVLLALGLNLVGLTCSLMVWRGLLADLGSRLTVPQAWCIMFVGQLAKYIPGSLWPVLAQAELGADRRIPRSRTALSVLLSYAVMTCSGAVVAAVTLPFATAGSVAQYFWVLFLIPVGAVLLSPPALNRLLRLVLRLSGQPPLQRGVSFGGLARTMAWAVAGWGFNGLGIYVLMRQLSGHPQGTLLVSVGGYALSWAAGFLAVFAPAGAGVREAVMIAVLHTRTTTAIALTVTLMARATSVLCDALAGAAAGALIGRRRLQRLRAARRAGGRGEPGASVPDGSSGSGSAGR